jgi:hypothetical protein
MAPRLFMSGKLYWRYKKDGKWTWRPAVVDKQFATMNGTQYVVVYEQEVEE